MMHVNRRPTIDACYQNPNSDSSIIACNPLLQGGADTGNGILRLCTQARATNVNVKSYTAHIKEGIHLGQFARMWSGRHRLRLRLVLHGKVEPQSAIRYKGATEQVLRYLGVASSNITLRYTERGVLQLLEEH